MRDWLNGKGEPARALFPGRWKDYLAIAPMLLVLPGCAHSPSLAVHKQEVKPSLPAVSVLTPANKPQPDGDISDILRLKSQLKLTRQLPAKKPVDPLLAGIPETDIENAKRQAKRNYELSWGTIEERSRYVRNRMLATLNSMKAPASLQVIPAVESTYSPYALSHAGAVGLWQLMPRTAHSLGVRSDKKIDGRRHIAVSTEAAVRYLLKMHERFDNWPLAIAAYNMGPNAVSRRLRKKPWHNSDGLENMPIPASTRAYVQHVIGLAALVSEHSFSFPKPVKTRKLELKAPVDLNRLAKISGMPEHDIFRYNPSLNQGQYLNRNIIIHVPESHYEAVQSKLSQAGPRFVSKTVKQGDSLWSIARTHKTSVDTLKSLNKNIGKYLHIGQRLKVPANQVASANAMVNPLLPTNRRIRYRVRSGDSLWRIANRFGTTPKAIARSNRISMNSLIRVGETLWVYARVRPS